jgi:mannitol/fructose-specific phosphotransferase system IIA component (Ntr-type)
MARSSKKAAEMGIGMKLTEYLTKDCIVSNLKTNDKIHAIKELTRLLHKRGKIDELDGVLDRVVERESFDSTGIGSGIAIPHARINTLDGLVCAVGRKKEGLEYRSIDGKPVNLIFLILYPPVDSHKYLYFIASLSRLVLNENLVEKLMQAATSTSMYKVLDKASETLVAQGSDEPDAARTVAEGVIMRGSNTDLTLLIRLMRMEDIRRADKGTAGTMGEKIEQVRSCVSSRILAHYDRLKGRVSQPVVAVEEDICLGCNLHLSSAFSQELRDSNNIKTCPNCTRFLYAV